MFNRFKTTILLPSQTIPLQEARPASPHMPIVNPLACENLMALFSTHPPME